MGTSAAVGGFLVECTGRRDVVTAAGLALGVLANFSVLVRFSRRWAWLAAAAPRLVPALAASSRDESPRGPLGAPSYLVRAVGISLIHLSVHMSPARRAD